MKTISIHKPKQHRSQQKFAAVLAACPQVMKQFGYQKSTSARIAVEADISIGSFYDYFSCKEAAFIAYLDQQLHSALSQVAADAQRQDQCKAAILRALIATGIDFAYQQRPMLQQIFSHSPQLLPVIDLSQSKQRILDIALIFADGDPAPQADDFSLKLYSLTNIVLGFQLRIVFMADEGFSRKALVDELMRIIQPYTGISHRND